MKISKTIQHSALHLNVESARVEYIGGMKDEVAFRDLAKESYRIQADALIFGYNVTLLSSLATFHIFLERMNVSHASFELEEDQIAQHCHDLLE